MHHYILPFEISSAQECNQQSSPEYLLVWMSVVTSHKIEFLTLICWTHSRLIPVHVLFLTAQYFPSFACSANSNFRHLCIVAKSAFWNRQVLLSVHRFTHNSAASTGRIATEFVTGNFIWNFDVLLTLHLSIFILVFKQIDAKNLFYRKFYFTPLYVSRTCAHHQKVKIALYSLWYHYAYRLMIPDAVNINYTRGYIMQFWPPDDEHMCSKHVEAEIKLIVKQILCINLIK